MFGLTSGLMKELPMRTKRTAVTFRHPFELNGFDYALPAGTYELSIEEEETDTVLTQGWRRVSTLLCTPSIERSGGSQQWTSIRSADLEAALVGDEASSALNKR